MHQKYTHTVIDYRNARYQGSVDKSGSRNGMGIMVDDDLSFYVSQWNNNSLNGETLVYISHGKYIYGSWQNNEPNGVNVFRSGETVLVGEFENGRIINKLLVIFQKYNIIAVLETSTHKQQFDVISCGKLLTHDDLTNYIQMLDIEMPQNYFSLIKFVTSLTDINQHQSETQSLIASPCEGENCYFGYRDGLAIIFNSNNGVVSVGQHENKKISGFGGKFDGKKIQQGNFELQETITYQKKRPNNQIYTIFQKLHKRSLNFKNQYFDSKVKTLGDLQILLRGNIQKIVNYNMKNGLKEATAGQLNDSLDYQAMDEYESVKAAQNRQSMYERETPVNMKKTVSSYYKEEKDFGKSHTRSPIKQNFSQSTTKRQSKITPQQPEFTEFNDEQTQRRTPKKDSNVYYAKKSPIRFKEEERTMYDKQSRTYEKQTKNRKYIPDSQRQEQLKVSQKPYSRMSTVSQSKIENNRSRSPMNYTKNIEQRTAPISKEMKQKIPKFGGLQIEEIQRPHRKSTYENEVEEYKKVLEKSRSREKLPGQSLGKYLKRPNYEDIEERRKRILGQFQQLNQNESAPLSQVSKFSDARRTPQRGSMQIDFDDNSRQSGNKQYLQSPCMKEKILSFTSENDTHTQNSSEGCLPLSLINNDRTMRSNNRINRQNDQISDQKTAFGKKQSTIDRLQFSNGTKAGKQNVNYTPGSFTKYKKDLDDIKVEPLQSEKKNEVKRFYCKQADRTMQLLNMTKKPLSQHIYPDNQQQEENHFSQIQLKSQQINRRTDRFADKLSEVSQRQGVSRTRPTLTKNRQTAETKQRDYYGQKQSAIKERDNLTIGDDLSRRRKGYKYYFDG